MSTERRVAIAIACAAFALACGVEGRAEREAQESAATAAAREGFGWPDHGKPRPVAVLQVRGHGEIRVALYPELTPASVSTFTKLANASHYDGTTFHRVIPGFMIQGGDPNSRDDDPGNDGYGHAQVEIPDEFGRAPHVRGVLSLAHTGAFGETSSQFFIVQADSPHLDEHYNVLGRVVSGMEIVDAVTKVETDANGRWGPPARPLEDVVIERIWVEPPSAGDLARAQR